MTEDVVEKVEAFPKEKVIAVLTEWWASEKVEAEALGALTSEPKAKPSILTPIIEIDSHRVVRALLVAEEVVGREIPESVIKSGGYDSFEELVADLLPKIEKVYYKGRK